MKIAVIGSRNLTVKDLGAYIPKGVTEIVSGGAAGIDSCAEAYALAKGIKFTVFLPDYKLYGKAAPLKRNLDIIEYSDRVIALWDGHSRGTGFVIKKCRAAGKDITVHIID